MDHTQICQLIEENFDVQVQRAHSADDALAALRRQPFDLVLVNRLLDHDQTEGLSVIRMIKKDPASAQTPVMLVTNFSQHQDRAVAAGAEIGFGKASLAAPVTRQRLSAFLG